MSKEQLQSQENYSYVTRSIIRLFNDGALTNVENVVVEPEYGYTTRLEYKDGTFRTTYGNDLGLNPGASCDLAKDKGHSKFILRTMGVSHPEGKEFLLPWWAESIQDSQAQRGNTKLRTTDMIVGYLDKTIGYPAYVKPVSGSKGSGVYRVDEQKELPEIIEEYTEKQVRVAVVEKAVHMPDYRVVVLDGELISAYERKPLEVVGDGQKSVSELIDQVQELYIAQGRDTKIDKYDPRIAKQLGKVGLTLDGIIPVKQNIPLTTISNLSAGGTSVDITSELHPRWKDLTSSIARNFNLRLCGVDLACCDISGGNGEYSVLEVNAAPGLDHYASSGDDQTKIVDALYTKVLNTSSR